MSGVVVVESTDAMLEIRVLIDCSTDDCIVLLESMGSESETTATEVCVILVVDNPVSVSTCWLDVVSLWEMDDVETSVINVVCDTSTEEVSGSIMLDDWVDTSTVLPGSSVKADVGSDVESEDCRELVI